MIVMVIGGIGRLESVGLLLVGALDHVLPRGIGLRLALSYLRCTSVCCSSGDEGPQVG